MIFICALFLLYISIRYLLRAQYNISYRYRCSGIQLAHEIRFDLSPPLYLISLTLCFFPLEIFSSSGTYFVLFFLNNSFAQHSTTRTAQHTVQYSTAQSTVQYDIQYSTVRHTVQYTVQYTVQFNTQFNTQYSTQYSSTHSTINHTQLIRLHSLE